MMAIRKAKAAAIAARSSMKGMDMAASSCLAP
jgi:hypothetical protein